MERMRRPGSWGTTSVQFSLPGAVTGVWQDDKRFGLQVKVDQAQPLAPSGPKGLISYLERVKNVGPTRAARLFQTYGEGVLQAVDADPGTKSDA